MCSERDGLRDVSYARPPRDIPAWVGLETDQPSIFEKGLCQAAGSKVPWGLLWCVALLDGARFIFRLIRSKEDTDMGFPAVSIRRSLCPNENVIRRGTDYRAGTILLPSGTVLDAAALGLLASAGICVISVRQPRVCVLSTGDEVSAPHVHPLAPGKIYDANLTLLTARLAELGIPAVEERWSADCPAAAAEAMRELLERCDLLITTGGVSVGIGIFSMRRCPCWERSGYFGG